MMRENVFQLNVKIPSVARHACLLTKLFDGKTLNQFWKKKTESIVQNTLKFLLLTAVE